MREANMNLVRPYRETDRDDVHALYAAQALPYDEPAWGGMEVSALIKTAGQLRMAGFVRRTAEVYLLLDPTARIPRRTRIGELLVMHRELGAAAKRAGFSDVHCWVPPELAHFGPLLENRAFGWTKTSWPGYVKEL